MISEFEMQKNPLPNPLPDYLSARHFSD